MTSMWLLVSATAAFLWIVSRSHFDEVHARLGSIRDVAGWADGALTCCSVSAPFTPKSSFEKRVSGVDRDINVMGVIGNPGNRAVDEASLFCAKRLNPI